MFNNLLSTDFTVLISSFLHSFILHFDIKSIIRISLRTLKCSNLIAKFLYYFIQSVNYQKIVDWKTKYNINSKCLRKRTQRVTILTKK